MSRGGGERDAKLSVGNVLGHCLSNGSILGTLVDDASFLGVAMERTLGVMDKMDWLSAGDSVPRLGFEGYEGTGSRMGLRAGVLPA